VIAKAALWDEASGGWFSRLDRAGNGAVHHLRRAAQAAANFSEQNRGKA
jgi:hypothetical protein